MRTLESVGATRAMSSRTRPIAGLSPIISPLSPYSRRSVFASRRTCRSSRAELSASNTPSGLSGFSRKLNAPSFVARTASDRPARPLIITTGTSGSFSRSLASVAIPSISPGIMRSSRSTSGSFSSARWRPVAPSCASRTSYPSAPRSAPTIRRIFGSSSTISTLGIATLCVCRQRPWLRHDLCEIALRLRDALHLDRHRLDGLLDSLESILDICRERRRHRGSIHEASRECLQQRNAQCDDGNRYEERLDDLDDL